jgi:serine phosphatase RsbU (regulator of sigma subunit)
MPEGLKLDFPGGGRAAIELDGSDPGRVFVIGRPSASDAPPDVPLMDAGVSRRHAELRAHGGQWRLRNLGKAGTLLDQRSVEADAWVPLAHGSMISIGPFMMRVDLGKGDLGGHVALATMFDDNGQARAVPVPRSTLERLAELRLSSLISASARIHAAEDDESLARAVAEILMDSRDFDRAAVLESVQSESGMQWRTLAEAGAQGGPFSRTLLSAAREARAMVQVEDDLRFRAAESMIGASAALCAPINPGRDVPRLFVYADCRAGGQPGVAAIPFANLVAQLASAALGAAEQRRLVTDLEQARQIQQRLMPEESGRRGHVSWTRFSRAADTRVSGDFFSVVESSDGRIAAMLGDVAGKGAGAALVMAAAVTHLDTSVRMGLPIEDAVSAASDFFASRPSLEVAVAAFTTAVAVEVHPDGRCRAVDAAHSYAAIVRADGRAEQMKFPSGGTMIGSFTGVQYCADDFRLEVGDRIVLFSDGVAEQRARSGDRLCAQYHAEPTAILRALQGSRGPDDDVRRLHELLVSHAGDMPWDDDVTIASIAYQP